MATVGLSFKGPDFDFGDRDFDLKDRDFDVFFQIALRNT